LSESIENKVKLAITNHKRGKIFFPITFAKVGSSTAIRQALIRLEKDGFILRLAHGIYLYPKTHSTLGILYPSLDEVATAIAKRDKARIIPTGILALNKLGWSTQVPMNVVYFTDGSERTIKINYGAIKFKRATSKLLSLKSKEMILLIQALRELGEKGVTDKIKSRIKQMITTVDSNLVNHDLQLAPQWITKLITNLQKSDS
jgi:hypothetical protein